MHTVKPSILLVDYLSLFYRALHANPNLSFAGEHTGAAYGFLMQLCKAINDTRPDQVLVCSDSKPYFRTSDYPKYKAERGSKDRLSDAAERIAQGHAQCSKILSAMGIPYLAYAGLEADDLIAIYVKRFHNRYSRIIAASTDSDLYQLFDFKTFELFRGKNGPYHCQDFRDDYGVKPSQWVSVVALTGGHNSLPNVPGIGEKTAIRIINEKEFGDSKKELLEKHKEQIYLNMRLAKLPYFRFRNWWKVKPDPAPVYNERKLMQVLASYGIKFNPLLKNACEQLHL